MMINIMEKNIQEGEEKLLAGDQWFCYFKWGGQRSPWEGNNWKSPEGNERKSHEDFLGKSIPGREKSKYKALEMDVYLTWLMNSQKASVAGTNWIRSRVVGDEIREVNMHKITLYNLGQWIFSTFVIKKLHYEKIFKWFKKNLLKLLK